MIARGGMHYGSSILLRPQADGSGVKPIRYREDKANAHAESGCLETRR